MGNGTSLPKVEGFSPDEVARLEKRFQKLDLDHSRCPQGPIRAKKRFPKYGGLPPPVF